MKKKIFLTAALLISTHIFLLSEPLPAGVDLNYAQVLSFSIIGTGENQYTFSVTLHHNDQGWDHYADAWEILDADTNSVLAVRTLLHPHVEEQPFTRSMSGIRIPPETERILIRGRCNIHGYGGQNILFETEILPVEGQSLLMQ